MNDDSIILKMPFGKIVAGTSTFASSLAGSPETVLIAEDDWLNALLAYEMVSLPDNVRCSSKLRRVMARNVAAVLNAGGGRAVVLEPPANTVEQRGWMRGILGKTTAVYQPHLLEVSGGPGPARIRGRNGQGDPTFAVAEAEFHLFYNYFSALPLEERFTS